MSVPIKEFLLRFPRTIVLVRTLLTKQGRLQRTFPHKHKESSILTTYRDDVVEERDSKDNKTKLSPE